MPKTKAQRDHENFQIQSLLDEGYDVNQIAGIIGLSPEAVGKRVNRGLTVKKGLNSPVPTTDFNNIIQAERFDAFDPGGQLRRARDKLNDSTNTLYETIQANPTRMDIYPVLLEYLKEARAQVKLFADVSQQIASAQAQKEFEMAVANVLQKVSPDIRAMLTTELKQLQENRTAVST